jgi:hypothetical protein
MICALSGLNQDSWPALSINMTPEISRIGVGDTRNEASEGMRLYRFA